MQRLFCVSRDIIGDKIFISNARQIHHLKDVLRSKAGDCLVVCDEKGNEYDAAIEKITFKNVELKIREMKSPDALRKTKVTVACAIPKKSKFDDIVDRLTQLGVERIIPLRTERVIIKLDSHKESLRLARWEKLVLSAAEQSQRKSLPVIDPVTQLEEVLLEAENYDLKLVPALIGERQALVQVLSKKEFQNILVLIGPEGDFSPRELKLAESAGFIPITLGEFVLRVETAAVTVASFIRLYYEKC